jgi:predicted membrane channel-forming protein YqfA (hemolysin III family)
MTDLSSWSLRGDRRHRHAVSAGRVLYSVGVMFHLCERLPYQQPVWDGFVVVGAAYHYAAVFGEITVPGAFT